MDSIERMRRINDLTRELKQRGFAESSFEAIQQANQIYGDEGLDENVKNGMIQKSAHERMVKDETMGDDSISYTDRKIAKISENVDALTNKMNEIIKAINDLDSRMNDIKAKQDKMVLARVEVPAPIIEAKQESVAPAHVEQPQAAPAASHVEDQPHVKKDEYAMNQRTGNFQSQDVAIDKMFYFGNKKS